MTAADVIKRTGVSYRQLYYWVSQGYIPGQSPKPPGSGNARIFTTAQVAHIARLKQLIDAGIGVREAVDALGRAVQTPGGVVAALTPHVRITVTSPPPSSSERTA